MVVTSEAIIASYQVSTKPGQGQTDASLLNGRRDGAPIYIGSHVWQDGRGLGYTVFEPYVVLVDGVIESLIGQRTLRVGCSGSNQEL